MAEAGPRGSYGWPDFDKAVKSGQKFARVSAGSPLLCIVLSEKPFVYEGHFWTGRMWPHLRGGACPPCKAKVGRQDRAVFSIWVPSMQLLQALDLPAEAARAVWHLACEKGELRGLALEIQKADCNYRGRLIVGVDQFTHVPKSLPEAHDVGALVEETWRDLISD